MTTEQAVAMLAGLARFFREDGYTHLDWINRCDEAWETVTGEPA